MSDRKATARVWKFGRFWNMHARLDGAWIRITGIPDELLAHDHAETAKRRLNAEYERTNPVNSGV